MTNPDRGTNPDDAQWRRPPDVEPTGGGDPPRLSRQSSTPGRSPYVGPPPSAPPPSGWRPEFVVQPSAPRSLPAQDHTDLDAQERSARTLTYGIGLVAGAVVLVLLCALCGRALF